MAKPFKDAKALLRLRTGDVIRHVSDSGDGYLVVLNLGTSLVVQRTVTATNPREWVPTVINGKRVE